MRDRARSPQAGLRGANAPPATGCRLLLEPDPALPASPSAGSPASPAVDALSAGGAAARAERVRQGLAEETERINQQERAKSPHERAMRTFIDLLLGRQRRAMQGDDDDEQFQDWTR